MRIRPLVLGATLATALSLPLGANGLAAEVYFSPSSDCEQQIVHLIDNSKHSLVAAVYSINNDEIVKALLRAHMRKVQIKILTDSTQASGVSSKSLLLKASGIDLRLHSKHKIEHNKFGVFDEKYAVNGSFNWTDPAARVNSENCVIFGSKEANVITAFKRRFEYLWSENPLSKSEVKIVRLKKKELGRMPANDQ